MSAAQMRICMIVSNDMTRDSRVDRHATALGMAGHQVNVLCRASTMDQTRHERRPHYEITRYYERLVEREKLRARHERIVMSNVRNAARAGLLSIPARLCLYAFALGMRGQVYYCNDLDSLDVGLVAKFLARKKLVYDAHEISVEMLPPGSRRELAAFFEKLFVNFADVLITVNPFLARELHRRYNIRKEIHVVLNCPNAPLKPPKPKVQSDTVTVLYHGWLHLDRGLENLVLAAQYFRNNLRLIIRGEGKLENELKQLALNLPKVSFERSVPMSETLQAAAMADIGVIPYLARNINHYYSSPNKLFEYIQAGLAVVTSDLPFLRQFVTGNHVGVVFDPNDPSDIARKINFVSLRRNLMKFKRQVRIISQHYCWQEERNQLYTAIRVVQT